MTALHQQIRRTIAVTVSCRAARGGGRASGGSDSVAMTRLLLDLAENGEFEIAASRISTIGCVRRRIETRHSVGVRQRRLALPFVWKARTLRLTRRSIDCPLRMPAAGCATRFLQRTAAALGASRIAVAHTQDDQAETSLPEAHAGRGADRLGVSILVATLLSVPFWTRRGPISADICRQQGERWIEDETNDDISNPRNRVRHRVLPELDRAAGGPTPLRSQGQRP